MNSKFKYYVVAMILVVGCHSNEQTWDEKMAKLQIRKDSIYKRNHSIKTKYKYYSELTTRITLIKMDSLNQFNFNFLKLRLDSTLNNAEKLTFDSMRYFARLARASDSAVMKVNSEIYQLQEEKGK